MKPMNSRLLACLIVATALGTPPLAAGAMQDKAPTPEPTQEAQEPAKKEEQAKDEKAKPSPLEALGHTEPSEDELVALFARVETRLREIDRMLYDASSGKPIEGAEESGIADLLDLARKRSNENLDDIDRILQIAQERSQSSSSSSGGGGQEPQEGDSPLDGQQQQQPSERESTPDSPSSSKPESQPHSPSDDGDPQGEQESEGDPQNRAGGDPQADATEKAPPGTGNEAWGDLPIHVRELFRVQGGADLPPRYRDWIDSYYRRLNQKP